MCGHKLPEGLVESAKLPEAIFTPSTKLNRTRRKHHRGSSERVDRRGEDCSTSRYHVASFSEAHDYARQRGIIIADTKFEFGLDKNGELLLVDEALTPDSSRFWPADEYEPGRSQPSFDKQFVRDYLETLDWDKKPPHQ